MTQAQRTKQIEIACAEVRKLAPKPKPKEKNWNVHVLVENNRKEIKRLIKLASEKYGVDKEVLTNIIFR